MREYDGRENDELKLGGVLQICELHVLLDSYLPTRSL